MTGTATVTHGHHKCRPMHRSLLLFGTGPSKGASLESPLKWAEMEGHGHSNYATVLMSTAPIIQGMAVWGMLQMSPCTIRQVWRQHRTAAQGHRGNHHTQTT